MTLDKAVVLGVLVVVISIIGGIPAYVIGSRRRVAVPEVAFIPLVGPTIVMLRSMDMSSWIVLLQLIPLIDIIVTIWLVFAMPARHDRTRLWGVVLLVPLVNIVGYWVYAFTLSRDSRPRESGLGGYHLAPQAVPGRSPRR